MAQLKMYWLKGSPVPEPSLPEGYSFSHYKCPADKAAWVECCKNGLVADDAREDAFDNRILEKEDCVPETDVFFLDFAGEHIGTATAIFHSSRRCGELHMVGIRSDFRGKALVKYLNAAAIKKLAAQGVDYIFLTTDEWRVSAVKSYFSAGFVPVEYDEGMKERWEHMLAVLNIDGADMVNEDASFCRKLFPSAAENT